MAFSYDSSEGGRQPSIHTALGDIVTHSHKLLLNRLDLMQVEMREVGQRAIVRSVDIALGALLAFSGFVLLTAAAVMGLALYVGEAWSLGICGSIYALGGIAFVVHAKKSPAINLTTGFVPDADVAPKRDPHAN